MMKTFFSLYLFLFFFIHINSNAIFPSAPSQQELDCNENLDPSQESCVKMPTSDTQYTCCFVEGSGVKQCAYIENTEFGIKAYKHIYSNIDNLKIKCGGNYLRNILSLYLLILVLYL